jgi:hypothetical protein
MTELIKSSMTFNNMLQRTVSNCKGQRRDHDCEPAPIDSCVLPEDVALAVATRYWGTYLTLFGDHNFCDF